MGRLNVIYLADKIEIHNWVDSYEYQIEKSIGKPWEGKLQARFDAGALPTYLIYFIFVGRLYSTGECGKPGQTR
jgi:hypothetical protein